MLSIKAKQEISERIQVLLHEIVDDELPIGEIQFILHVDGKESWSWTNIRNLSAKNNSVPNDIIKNLSV